MILTDNQIQKLQKMGYRFAGKHYHAATKICHWTKKSILDDGVCYKEKFYGIKSHRCLQMSPSVPFCHQQCLFCWRDLSNTDFEWKGDYDEPKDIIDGCVEAQRNLLCGFFDIGSLISEFNHRNFTTFLVSNGLTPNRLKNLEEDPTQLYLSLDAPEEETYKSLCRPQIEGAWDLLNTSLEYMSSLNCRRVIRITAVNNKNMFDFKGYANLIDKANPDFVEIKAYMFVGYSRQRLELDNMPMFSEVKQFAESIGELCGREIINESMDSRVVLLG